MTDDALAKFLDQILRAKKIDVISGDGAYDTKPWLCGAIAARSTVPSISLREGAAHWPADTPGAAWRNGAVDAIARDGCREWKKDSGYHRRSLAENAMYRFKTLTGNRLWCVTSRRRGERGHQRAMRNQPHGGLRSSAIHSYRLKLCPSMPLRPHARFMHQRQSCLEKPSFN
ncbi:MAG: hypothetical protein E5299_01700 [Burkholderia gladioli]|nr:MAG: hypothetical protein E5299_01700 [Burkholderia gladioli]